MANRWVFRTLLMEPTGGRALCLPNPRREGADSDGAEHEQELPASGLDLRR